MSDDSKDIFENLAQKSYKKCPSCGKSNLQQNKTCSNADCSYRF